MKISVIIPAYNTGEYLKKCIESILGQTHYDLQVILINDGSDDNTLKIMQELKKRDSRICVVDKVHEGVSAARNAGLKVATGEYISFIDSDDWIDLDTYQVLLKLMLDRHADAVYYEWTEEYSDGSSEKRNYDGKLELVLDNSELIHTYFANKYHFRISSGLLKRRLVEDITFNTDLERGEDMLFGFYALCNARRAVYINLPLYHRFHRVGSLSNRRGFFKSDVGRAVCTDYMVEYISNNRKQYLEEAYAYSFTFYMIILNRLLYYHAEEENYDIYKKITDHLKEILCEIKEPRRVLPTKVLGAYKVFLCNKWIYTFIVKIYYKYVKRELDSKRQK